MASQTLKEMMNSLEMFKNSVQSIAIGKAMDEANDVVSAIRRSQLNERDQILEIEGVARGLTARMTGMGIKPGRIKQTVGNLLRPQLPLQDELAIRAGAEANALIQKGEANAFLDNKFPQAQAASPAAQLQADIARESMESRERLAIASANQKRTDKETARQDKLEERRTRAQREVAKAIEAPSLRARGAVGRAKIAANLSIGSRTLLGNVNLTDPNNLDETTRLQVVELVQSSAQLLRPGGSPTEIQLKELFPHAVNMTTAQFQEFLTSKPMPANVGEFVSLLSKIAQREGAINRDIVEQHLITALRGRSRDVFANPEDSKRAVAAAFGIPEEDVIIDEKNRRISTKGFDRKEKATFSVLPKIQKLYQIAKSRKPQAARAKQQLEKLGFSTDMTPTGIRNEVEIKALMGLYDGLIK